MSLCMYLYDVTIPGIVVVVFTRPLGTSPSPLLVKKIFARFDESLNQCMKMYYCGRREWNQDGTSVTFESVIPERKEAFT